MKARQIARWTLTVVFVLGSRLAGAQPGGDFGGDFSGGMPPFSGEGFERQQQTAKPDNKDAAKKMTDEMQRSLTLTDKQYKKVYKLNLKWLDERSAQSGTVGGAEGERPMPPMGGDPGGNDRGGFGSGERPGGALSGQERPEANRPQRETQTAAGRDVTDEQLEARNARLKKVLTADQYDRWLKSEADRRNHAHRKQLGDRFRER